MDMAVAMMLDAVYKEAIVKISHDHHTTTADVSATKAGTGIDGLTIAIMDEQNDTEFKFRFYIIFALD
jgi:hypothetical protein